MNISNINTKCTLKTVWINKYLLSLTHILKAQLSLASLFWAAIRSLAMMNSLKSRKPLPSVSRVLNTWSQKLTEAIPGGKKAANWDLGIEGPSAAQINLLQILTWTSLPADSRSWRGCTSCQAPSRRSRCGWGATSYPRPGVQSPSLRTSLQILFNRLKDIKFKRSF